MRSFIIEGGYDKVEGRPLVILTSDMGLGLVIPEDMPTELRLAMVRSIIGICRDFEASCFPEVKEQTRITQVSMGKGEAELALATLCYMVELRPPVDLTRILTLHATAHRLIEELGDSIVGRLALKLSRASEI